MTIFKFHLGLGVLPGKGRHAQMGVEMESPKHTIQMGMRISMDQRIVGFLSLKNTHLLSRPSRPNFFAAAAKGLDDVVSMTGGMSSSTSEKWGFKI